MTTAQEESPTVSRAMEGLKDFQRRTVDYAFRRLYLDEDSTHRFLVADEVGLGKTLIAKGVIAKAVEHLWKTVDRIDIVYVCSNADIARQNIDRLRLDKDNNFARATRATLLPIELSDMANRRINYVSMTPGTSLEPRGGMGIAKERALLFVMLHKHWNFNKAAGTRVLRGGVLKDNFKWWIEQWIPTQVIDPDLQKGFLAELDRREAQSKLTKTPSLRARFQHLADTFPNNDRAQKPEQRDERRTLIADLRSVLGRTCITALRPDLVILDEFQRFKHLLDPTSEDAELARSLFEYADDRENNQEAVRVLLLSATPYKMYSLRHEQESDEGDHYADFVATFDFLTRHRNADNEGLQNLLNQYRAALMNVDSGGLEPLRFIKAQLEDRLRKVMSRTERLAITSDRSGMLRESASTARLHESDVHQYLAASKVAGLLDQGNIVEYWKSAPYLLNFMDKYELKNRLRESIDENKSADLFEALSAEHSGLLAWDDVLAYRKIDPANARLRSLLECTVEKDLWKLLWLPPALPYYPLAGAFANRGPGDSTKRLVFSSWKVVPKVIAAVLSHEAERRMMAASHHDGNDVTIANSTEGRKRIAALLRFARADDRLTGMPVLGLMYPSFALAEAFDPAHWGSTRTAEDNVLIAAQEVIRPLLDQAVSRWAKDADVDERWYWAAPILFDLHASTIHTREFWLHPQLPAAWSGETAETDAEGELESESAWTEHVAQARLLLNEASAINARPLGAPPGDLLEVLAKLAVGNPAIVAARAIGRVLGLGSCRDVHLRLAAGNIAWRFRNIFNLPEVNALVRGLNSEEPYWLRVAEYAVDGCLQAVLDEYAHVLRDSLSLAHQQPAEAAASVAHEMCRAIALRSAPVGVDDLRADKRKKKITLNSQRMRARFAARFGQQQDEEASERDRSGQVRAAFNSPFWPFVLASTSVGQEGLDFHHYCHAIVHWNLPSNPVDLEQREGRIHRYKGHAVRKNVAKLHGDVPAGPLTDRWETAFAGASADHAPHTSELSPFWVFPVDGGAVIERHVPCLPLSKDADRLVSLRSALALYRMVFGQPRQDELVRSLQSRLSAARLTQVVNELRINLEPPTETNTPRVLRKVVHTSPKPVPGPVVTAECNLLAIAKEAILPHKAIVPLGCFENRLWPFIPASWPSPLPPLCRGTHCEPSWWLAMWIDTLRKTDCGIMLLLAPMTDQRLRMRVVERLTKDPDEFGIRSKDFINHPGIGTQWVFLSKRIIAPLAGHGLTRDQALPKLTAAIDDFANRFARVGEVLAPLWAAR